MPHLTPTAQHPIDPTPGPGVGLTRHATWAPGLWALAACLALAARSAAAQPSTTTAPSPSAASLQPVRTQPVEQPVVKFSVRDLGPPVLAGGTLYVGSPTGAGGLYAVDAASGRLRWSFAPTPMNGSVSTRPVVVGSLVIAPFGAANLGAVIAVQAATGREVWRALDPSPYGGVVAEGERLFVIDKACSLHALAAATGRVLWKTPLRFVTGGACTTSPVVRDGVVYAQILARAPEGTAGWPDARYMAAFDAATGLERWRHRPPHPEYRQGAQPRHPVVTDSAVFFPGENALYALDRHSGQPLFAPVFLRRMVDGRERMVDLHGLIDTGGDTVVGATEVSLVAFDKASGRITWELPGRFEHARLSLAVAGPVLYFQGGLNGAPTMPGTLHAMDMGSRTLLWSHTRPNWIFGSVLPVDGALWVPHQNVLIGLRAR